MEAIRAGVIGVGLYGMGHVESYLALPNVDLIAIADVDEAKVKSVAREHGIPQWYTDYEDMLKDSDIQIVSIATPDHLHFEPTMAALNSGKNVFLEKPMALVVEEAEKIAKAAEAANRKLTVNFGRRAQLPSLLAKEAIDRGELGAPVYAYARVNNTLMVPTSMLSWSARTALPHWLMTHEYDRIRWFFGCEAKKVYAVSKSGVLKEMGIEADDVFHATVEFENGAIGVCETAWILPETAPFIAQCKAHFIFSKGWVNIDNSAPVLTISTEDRFVQPGFMAGKVHGHPVGTIHEAIRQFMKCVSEDRPPIVSAQDGVAITKIACAIMKSAESGQPVELI